jgi:hypothetical protein
MFDAFLGWGILGGDEGLNLYMFALSQPWGRGIEADTSGRN